MFFKFSSQITPGTIYHVDLGGSQPQVTVHLETKVHRVFQKYITIVEYVFCSGTWIRQFQLQS